MSLNIGSTSILKLAAGGVGGERGGAGRIADRSVSQEYEAHHNFMIECIAGRRIGQNSCIIHFAAAKASKTTLLADACDSKNGVDFCDPFLQPLCGVSVLIVC